MSKWQKESIQLHLEHLNDRINDWTNNLNRGSTDPTYSIFCSAKLLEATAEMNGIIYTLSVLGYDVHFTENAIGLSKCEIVEMDKVF